VDELMQLVRFICAWAKLNLAKKFHGRAGREMPDRNDEYLIYQTMLGACPFEGPSSGDFPARLKAYAVKAAREAQVNTNWIKPDAQYEAALAEFIDKALAPSEGNRFLADFETFRKTVAFYGTFNQLDATPEVAALQARLDAGGATSVSVGRWCGYKKDVLKINVSPYIIRA